ncbi:MAG TPA: D-alanine--D-alanine ligase [Desulfomonilia bacterium]
MSKIRVGIIFGGRSAEHEVSLQSAKNVIAAIDRNKYEVVLISMDKEGGWHLTDETGYLLNETNPKLIALNKTGNELALVPGESSKQLMDIKKETAIGRLDVVFPVLHGTYGEDGTIQGMLKLADIPFVGAGVLGSAVGMDKDVAKRLLRDAGIRIADFITLRKEADADFKKAVEKLGLPLFIKPANMGSSVGVSKADSEEEFMAGVKKAFEYDMKVLVEECIKGREIECSVLGNDDPIVSVPGEIIPNHEFYSYEAKYIDENGAILEIPAKLPEGKVAEFRETAKRVYETLNCEGMARVDFFLKESGEIIVNEINTIPGFTRISMYPKLWEACGISYKELIDRLIGLALERFEKQFRLKTGYDL